ncbi:MAG TPA: tetratricopeptide repeat protein [Ferruginibacter sp.]|jgi:Flp pilus assembly protein TadD|nr:tetratricopeptide repeat protein [Ferruginibacter sp.]
MNKIKSVVLLSVLFISTIGKAQSIDEGKKLFYYEKYISAKEVFSKLIAANPNDIDAAYWLGQSEIQLDDTASAEALYQKTLMTNSNSPLLIAGLGHIELLQGNIPDAHNRFETAISLSNNKNAAVLNAIGFANVDVKGGDANYAIEKLTLATTLKGGSKDPDVFCNLGDAYKKIGDGGNAQLAYQGALAIQHNYARASFRIGKIYQTQGYGQRDIYMKYYNDAVTEDPNYSPVYYNFYDYYYTTDVTQSAAYLEKYLNLKGIDEPNACYYRASMKYAQGLFKDAITQSDNCIGASATPFPSLYGLKAYAYFKLGDSADAKTAFELYFAKQAPAKIGPTDYITYTRDLLKLGTADSALATASLNKGLALDVSETDKVNHLKSIAADYEAAFNFKAAGDYYNKIVAIKAVPTKADLYNAGYSYFRAGAYKNSIAVFNVYTQKFPDDAFGYYMTGKAYWGIDSTMQKGLANPSFQKAIEVGNADTAKYKQQLIGSYKYFVPYYVNVKRDKQTALDYCDKILALDPTDSQALSNKEVISKLNLKPQPAKKPAS